jgi:hypothetical protein
MARILDPNLFPLKPGQFLQFSLLPQFGDLIAIMCNFSVLVGNESAERRKGNKPPEPYIDFIADIWLASGINEAAINLDTGAIAAATLIRNEFERPVLEKTNDALKPEAVKLMRRVDEWMADGIRLIFNGQVTPSDASASFNWDMRKNDIFGELKRIWSASGGGPQNELTANLTGASAKLANATDSGGRWRSVQLEINDGKKMRKISTKIPIKQISPDGSMQEKEAYVGPLTKCPQWPAIGNPGDGSGEFLIKWNDEQANRMRWLKVEQAQYPTGYDFSFLGEITNNEFLDNNSVVMRFDS